MKKGIIIDANDLKKIIAEHFNVDESKVIKSQYSWITFCTLYCMLTTGNSYK